MIIPICKNITLDIPKEKSFEVPQGEYRATLKEVIKLEQRPTKRGLADQVRLLFEIHPNRKSNKQLMAGKNYEPTLASGSELREDLLSWCGPDFMENETTLDLNKLIDTEADLKIVHIKNSGFQKPYVCIKAIKPAGALVPTYKDIQEGI